jgi:isoprenylcysteine carboxyl methyltransferase (ICMT) family protein YpbQ
MSQDARSRVLADIAEVKRTIMPDVPRIRRRYYESYRFPFRVLLLVVDVLAFVYFYGIPFSDRLPSLVLSSAAFTTLTALHTWILISLCVSAYVSYRFFGWIVAGIMRLFGR